MLIINPFTCCMFMDLIQSNHSRAVIQTGAASTCGKILYRYCKHEQVPIINVVYRSEQVELMRNIGAEHVLCSSDPDFPSQLAALSQELQPSIAFDCVAGPLTAQILSCLQPKSTLYLYGFLSMRGVENVEVVDLLFHGKCIEGLILKDWMGKQGWRTGLRYVLTVQRLFHEVFYSEISHSFPLEEVQAAFESFRTQRSLGKTLLTPS